MGMRMVMRILWRRRPRLSLIKCEDDMGGGMKEVQFEGFSDGVLLVLALQGVLLVERASMPEDRDAKG